jgi:leucyl aminopeptidase
MNLSVVQGDIAAAEADLIVVNLFEGVTLPGGATALLYSDGRLPAARVLIAGLGKAEKFDANAVRKVAAMVQKTVSKLKGVQRYATITHGAGIGGLAPQRVAQALAEGILMAAYQVPNYKREAPESGPTVCMVVERNEGALPAIRAGVTAGVAVATGIQTARDLSNEPPNVLNPVAMTARAQALAAATGLHCTVLGEAEMAALNMGILLAVSRGSANEAQMIVLEHAPLVLVGKGITFDTGGISIKPTESMELMKHDMSGAAAVIGAMEAIARLGVQRRVIGVAACVENMPDGNAFRPGDILTGMTGKSCEILSTDAEGRLILADSLAYVARFQPAAVVDLATLTGAIGVALGPHAAGLFSNNSELERQIGAAAERAGERVWPMPMWDEYMDAIKGDMGEVRNTGGRAGGVATSAKFIEHFTEGYPWAHLDIASVAWVTAEKEAGTPKGATGYGVRLLVELANG